MPKKVTDAEGNTFVEVKPWYRKWWIWVIAVLAIFVIGAAVGGGSDSDSDSSSKPAAKRADTSSKTASSSSSSDVTSKTLKVGQTANIDGVHLKVNSVKPASSFDDGMSTPKSGNQYYTVNVTLNNTGSEKQDYNPLDFSIVANGNSTDMDETNTDDDNTLDTGSLNKGGHVTGDLIGQSKKTGKVQLVYKPNWLDDRKITFDLQE